MTEPLGLSSGFIRQTGFQVVAEPRQSHQPIWSSGKGAMLRGFRDLRVYNLAYKLAMEVFELTKPFPPEERYSLTSQIRRSSRSVAANIAEGFRKRRYPNMFVSKLADSDAEATETQAWLEFACGCGYLSKDTRSQLVVKYEEMGRMIGKMMGSPERFLPA